MPIVKRRIASDDIVDVAVGIDAAGPTEHKGLEVAFRRKLQCRGELGRLNSYVETALFCHGLDDLGGLEDNGVISSRHRDNRIGTAAAASKAFALAISRAGIGNSLT